MSTKLSTIILDLLKIYSTNSKSARKIIILKNIYLRNSLVRGTNSVLQKKENFKNK